MNIYAPIIFFALQKLIAITIAFWKSYQCAIMSEINLNTTFHRSNGNRLLRHFIPWLLMISINSRIIFFALHKLIAITIVFHKSYQCDNMSEITVKISLHGCDYNRLLRHFIPWLLIININEQIIF